VDMVACFVRPGAAPCAAPYVKMRPPMQPPARKCVPSYPFRRTDKRYSWQ
jgi:hypothetical protein